MRIRIGVNVGPDKLYCCVFNGPLVRNWYNNAACTLVARGVCVFIVQTDWRVFHSVHANSCTGIDLRLAQLVHSELMWSHRPKWTVDDTLAVV